MWYFGYSICNIIDFTIYLKRECIGALRARVAWRQADRIRAPDERLRHVYHRVSCSTGASSEGFQASSRVQVRMCVGSRLANAASGGTLLVFLERFSRAHCPFRTNCTLRAVVTS